MSLQTIPGFTGFQYARFSSHNRRAIGKFTDTNHLLSIQRTDPADYDKKIIQIYTQSSLYANDFLTMINQSTPYFIEYGDTWKWKIEVPFQYAVITGLPDSTAVLSKPGIDGQPFDLILDTGEFSKNETVIIGHRQYGPQLAVISDPSPVGRAFQYSFQLITDQPTVDFVDKGLLQPGVNVLPGTSIIGEFDTELPGLGRPADTIELFESLGSAMGRAHRITKWADEMNIQQVDPENGMPADMVMYFPQRRNSTTTIKPTDVRWEPYVEMLLRKKMLEDRVNKMIWGKAGAGIRTDGSKQEFKRLSDGVYQRIRKYGNYVPINRGEFTTQLLRAVFGDLFYRRVSMGKRRVKLYTNEAGIDVWQTAIKQDALNSGITFTSEIPAVRSGSVGPNDASQHLSYSWAFDTMVTRETGTIEVVHLMELDQPETNLEFGQNKKSTPIFFVFNVSPDSDGTFAGNIREVRLKGAPSMTWGYVDGRQSHLGHFASKGMQSASMDPGYSIWFEDRVDVFVEDLSRCVLIEEIPQY